MASGPIIQKPREDHIIRESSSLKFGSTFIKYLFVEKCLE